MRNNTPVKKIIHYLLCITFLFLLASVVTSQPTQQSVPVIESPFTETSCRQQTCTTTIYSYTKYYQESGVWIPINENIESENCLEGYTSCVNKNLYQAHFKPATVHVVTGEQSITLTVIGLGTTLTTPIQPSPIAISNNQYQIRMFPNANVTYTYFPEFLKEEITLTSPPVSAGEYLQIQYALELSPGSTIDPLETSSLLKINHDGQTPFTLTPPFAQDATGALVYGQYTVYQNETPQILEMRFPYQWFTQATYPVIIDPTIVLNASNTTWNGYLHHNATHYFRYDNPFILKIGHFFRNTTTFINDTYRSIIEFDTSTIPKNASIQKIDLTTYSTQAGTVGNNNISIHPLEKNNTQYSTENQTCLGNCNHHADAGNGTLYTSKNTTAGYNTFNLDTSINEFTTALQTQSWFSYGLSSHDGESQHVHGNQDARIASKDYPTPNNRPFLNITYILNQANETQARTAIETAIQNTLGTQNQTNKQIYVVKGTHSFNTFDMYTEKNNQSWTFNYITGTETFTNLPSLFRVLNVWENQTLTTTQITEQVTNFITNTTI